MTPEKRGESPAPIADICLYFATFFLAWWLKDFYSHADAESLGWILGPTAGLVEQISGMHFEKEAYTGYVNLDAGIIIAPSCAGLNFLIISFCMAVFSNVRHCSGTGVKCLWMGLCCLAAYLQTITVNAIRIMVSIHLYGADIYGGCVTPERVHRIEGIIVYFLSLCLFHHIMARAVRCLSKRQKGAVSGPGPHGADYAGPFRCLPSGVVPFFWYASIVLGVPVINAALRKDLPELGEHAWTVISVCLVVIVLGFLVKLTRHWRRAPIRIEKPEA